MSTKTRRNFLAGSASALTGLGLAEAAAGRDERAAGAGPAAIDAHAHMPLARFGNPLARTHGKQPQAGTPGREAKSLLADAVQSDTFEALLDFRLAEMDRWGVARTVAMPIDFSFGADVDPLWIEADALAGACNALGGRFIFFFACDPRRPDALELLGRAKKELGAKGVKLHPLAGFAVDDREVCYAFYERCAELGLPVLGHCRPLGAAARDDLYRPERYARVAEDFPELKICLGHAGGPPWRREALDVIGGHENAWGDLAMFQTMFARDEASFFDYLKKAMSGPAGERMMFGTDWPNGREETGAWLTAIRRGGPEAAPGTIDEGQIEALLSGNAKRFMDIK